MTEFQGWRPRSKRSPQPPTSASAMYMACAAARLIVDNEDACFYYYDAYEYSKPSGPVRVDGNVTVIFTKRGLGRQGVAGGERQQANQSAG
ncbi:unnamed protein product [Clonostachys rhizophaga]|uniref:Uncharacterized protein n=1 Tax=Clonostachys rhizophaga TaxID=160324 RepID=A0A9N9V2Z0_9HYPO|nr:unnamed protein product [Clonostachys rhizophaga]